MKKVLLRADGGINIGYGHWSRCFNLLTDLKDISVSLFTKNADQLPGNIIPSFVSVYNIDDEEEFISAVQKHDLVIVDHYGYNETLFHSLAQKGALIVLVDDFIHKAVYCDIIINHTPGIEATMYTPVNPGTSYYLGLAYNLTSKSFSRYEVWDSNRLEYVLVSMGGADPDNYTCRVLDKLAGLDKEIIVVIGDAYVHAEKLNKLIQQQSNRITVKKGIDKTELNHLMNQCGIAFLSASTIAIEYASVGGLLLVQQTVDNQQYLMKGLVSSQIALNAENSLHILADDHATQIAYGHCLQQQQLVFDGKTSGRFQKLFDELALQATMQFRKAIIGDVNKTYDWATSEVIRRYAYSQSEIKFDEHKNWFAKKIEQEDCIYYIATVNDNAIGSLRIDVKQDIATISYLVDEKWHGKGIGRILLAEGLKTAMNEIIFGKAKMILGYVMKSNTASVKVFERLGFIKEDTTEYQDSYKFYKQVIHSHDNR